MNGLTWGNSAPMRHGTLNLYRERSRAEASGPRRTMARAGRGATDAGGPAHE